MNISGVGVLLAQQYKERARWLTHKVIEVLPHLYNFGNGELKALEKQWSKGGLENTLG